jgi:hypothetical protein
VKLVDELLIEEIRLLRFGHTRDAVTGVTLLRSADAVARPSDYGAACGDQEHTVVVRQVLDGQGLSSTAVHGGAVLHPP